jgi:hypothetical protein
MERRGDERMENGGEERMDERTAEGEGGVSACFEERRPKTREMRQSGWRRGMRRRIGEEDA